MEPAPQTKCLRRLSSGLRAAAHHAAAVEVFVTPTPGATADTARDPAPRYSRPSRERDICFRVRNVTGSSAWC